jgi:phosphatidylglycerol lysyltransferase
MPASLRRLTPVLTGLAFLVALLLLRRELEAYPLREVGGALAATPRERLALAVALTALDYALLTRYDALALRYAGQRVPPGRIVFTSFLAYAAAHNLGLPALTGGGVRLRLYAHWGVPPARVLQAAAFSAVTFWVGVLTVGGAALVAAALEGGAAETVPLHRLLPLGPVFLGLVAAYAVWSMRRPRPLRLFRREIPVPTPGLVLAQVALGTVDWIVSALVLYVLLPPSPRLHLSAVLAAFVLAQVGGVVSHVPGGLGVFDTLVLLLLHGVYPPPVILGAVLAYRVAYYLLPLLAAALLLAGYGAARHRATLGKAAARGARWAGVLAPPVLSAGVFAAGAILLLSGATPAARGRLERVAEAVPLPVIEASHLLASMAGMALLLLAWGLQRRLDAAYPLALGVLLLGIVFSLLKGFDWEAALPLAVLAAALAPSRRWFHRRTALWAERFSPGWTVAVMVALGGTVWLVLFAYRHVEYSNELWWRFALAGDAPRSLRAAVGAAVLAATFALYRLLAPAAYRPPLPTDEELARARPLVAASPHASAHLALLGDKPLLFSDRGGAFVMYGVAGRSWVALGDPVGPRNAAEALAWRFRDAAYGWGGWPVFYEVGPETLPLYLDLGLALHKVGEEARVALEGFSLEGSAHKPLRQVLRKLERERYEIEVAGPEAVPALLPELRSVSDAWLAHKATREKGFSLGRFDERYLSALPVALVRHQGQVVAFANLWRSGEHEELSVDLMRHLPDAPHGVMEALFAQLMLWGREEGFRWFNLGMSPLAGLAGNGHAPLWNRVGALLFRHGEHFYNFRGLRRYKEKFQPVWEPRYLASPGGIALPRTLANVAALVSGGVRGVFTR